MSAEALLLSILTGLLLWAGTIWAAAHFGGRVVAIVKARFTKPLPPVVIDREAKHVLDAEMQNEWQQQFNEAAGIPKPLPPQPKYDYMAGSNTRFDFRPDAYRMRESWTFQGLQDAFLTHDEATAAIREAVARKRADVSAGPDA